MYIESVTKKKLYVIITYFKSYFGKKEAIFLENAQKVKYDINIIKGGAGSSTKNHFAVLKSV